MPRFVFAFAIVWLTNLAASTAFAQQGLPPDQLKKIKAATVYIKVARGNQQSSGSGFVVEAFPQFGLIVTNHHVIDPEIKLNPLMPGSIFALRGKTFITVVFNSGEADEWTSPGEVLFYNVGDDLAVVKVKAFKPIPKPIVLDGPEKLPETTPVYVCGFPFGEDLAARGKNPEISIGQASVSSNRFDKTGKVVSIQLNGSLNPGNSGGPVLTQDGKLVGVAVKTILAAGIGLAVPPRFVNNLLTPAITDTRETWWTNNDLHSIEISLALSNPRLNVKNVVVY